MVDADLSETPVSSEFPVLKGVAEQSRLKVLLVKAGFAKAGDIDLERYRVTQSFADEVKEAVRELKSLGLVVAGVADEHQGGRVCFGKTQEDVDELITLGQKSTHREFGAIYGIPETAIKAYPDGVCSDSELPPDITNNSLFEGLPYMLSRENFREEWQDFVRKANYVNRTMKREVKSLGLDVLFKKSSF